MNCVPAILSSSFLICSVDVQGNYLYYIRIRVYYTDDNNNDEYTTTDRPFLDDMAQIIYALSQCDTIYVILAYIYYYYTPGTHV